jgi:sugar lactone lactonase YvrE
MIQPRALTFDQMGNLLFVTGGRICQIDRDSGTLRTIAGSDRRGFSGDGGLATEASIAPDQIAVDSKGNIFISEFENNRIRRVDAKTGIITTVAGNGLPHRPPQEVY